MASKEPPAKVQKMAECDSDSEDSTDFDSPWHFSDVVLVVEGRKFHVHKSILSMWSPVFEKMFTSGFKEKKAKEIPLPDKKADEFEVLLKLIYKFKTEQEVDSSNFEFILKLADEYHMEKVKKLCSDFMYEMLDSENCIEYCKVADQYGLSSHIEIFLREAQNLTLPSIQGNPYYKDISDSVKVQLLTQRTASLESLLKDYSSACSSMVADAYTAVVKKSHDTECDNNHSHAIDKDNPVTPRKRFDPSCHCCTRRLENKWPEKDALTKQLKAPLKKIRSFNRRYALINVVQEPPLAIPLTVDLEDSSENSD